MWTEEEMIHDILEVANKFDPARMPSRREIEEYYKNSSLADRISRNGGFYHWAEVLGLETKHSETKVGFIAENEIAKLLSDIGHSVEITNSRYPYDLLVDGCVKIDVKASHRTLVHGAEVYAYRLAKRQQTCDVYVFCEMEGSNIESFFVVPSNAITGQVQVEMGTKSTIFEKYRNRLDIIDDITNFYKSLISF